MGGYATSGASAGVMPADSIDDTEIDWGTGTNQVSLDDVTDGSTYAKVAASSLTTNEVTKLTDSAGDDLTVSLGGGNRVLTVSAAATVSQNYSTAGSPQFAGMTASGAVTPTTNDAAALGSATVSWADLFLASGALINCANGDYTVTHSTGDLAFSGSISF